MKHLVSFYNLVCFYARSFLRVYRRSTRFARLNPGHKGKIYFLDKKKRKIFFVYSRGRIDSDTADHIYTHQSYDMSFLRRYEELKETYKGMTLNAQQKCLIIDCGANIGLATRYFAEEFPHAFIVAIEPDISNCKLAQKNCGHLDNIVIKQCAIGSSSGFVRIDNNDSDPNAFRTVRDNLKNSIEITTIDSIREKYNGYQLFLTKIDIEGFEKDLFSSNTDWIRCSEIIVIETHDWMLPKEATSQNFLKAISKENRDFIVKGENIFSIANKK